MYYSPETKCSSCQQVFGNNPLIESIQRASNGMIQIRGECPFCRTWVKFIPYRDSQYVKNILKLFYHNDLEALKELRKTAVYDYKKQEIR